MHQRDIPERWQAALNSHVYDNTSGKFRGGLGAMNFDNHVRLRFLGGSSATFLCCFFLTNPEQNEMLVVTEHNMHHIFPLVGTEIELLTDDDVYGSAD